MKNLFEKNFTRREFINTSTKFLAGATVFGLFPEVEAARKKITVPEIKKFTPLEELEIGKVFLKFDKMDLRHHTGAIVVHHTGMRLDRDMTVTDIHRLHRNSNRWAGIGYHFVVHKDGYIEQGRPLEYRGAHTSGNNEFTVGVCLAGNYDIGQPPQEQLFSAEQLIAALCDKYKFQPTTSTIFGHRDLCKTSCPGSSLYPLLPDMIRNIQKII